MLRMENLTVDIDSVRVCRELTLEIRPGQCWALLGRNGTGKTTLLHTLAGLRQATAGSIKLDGVELAALGRREIARSIGILPQQTEDYFPSTVLETAALGRYAHRSFWQLESESDRDKARQVLAQLGLLHLQARSVNSLSGGERRRVAIATLLAQEPRILLLDEPINQLDLPHQIATLELFRSLVQKDQCSAVAVMHEVTLAYRYCDHALLLFGEGNYSYGPVADILTAENLEKLYSHPINILDTPVGRAFLPG